MTEHIITTEELDALPVGSVVLDYEREAWQKVSERLWVCTSGDSSRLHWSDPDERVFTLLYRPDAPTPVDAETTTEWGVRRETKHFGTVIDPSPTREGALRAAEALRDPTTLNHAPSAVAVSRTVTTTAWQEVRNDG